MRPPTSLGTLPLVLLATLACSETVAPTPQTGLLIVAAPAHQDTIDAEPSQAIVVELRDSTGAAIQGSTVHFTGLTTSCPPTNDCASMLLSPTPDGQHSRFSTAVTGSDGRAAMTVRYGGRAGPGGVIVGAPTLGITDTLRFTIHPGNLTRLRVLPSDTAMVVGGATFTPRVGVFDRYGNPRSDPVTLTTPSPTLTASNGVVRSGPLPERALVVASAGAHRDTLQVSVVPTGVLVATRVTSAIASLVMFNTDGTDLREIQSFANFSTGAPVWSADGASVIHRGGTSSDAQLVKVSVTGTTTHLTTTGVHDAGWPTVSADGQWIYFSGRETVTHHVWRMHLDGSGLERVSDSTATVAEARPSTSADGTLMAYERNSTIVVRNLVTGEITTTPHFGVYARFSPASDRIAYLESGQLGIALMDPDGTNQQNLVGDHGTYYSSVNWSPDGQWLVTTRNSQLLLIEVASGLQLPVALPGTFFQPAWRP